MAFLLAATGAEAIEAPPIGQVARASGVRTLPGMLASALLLLSLATTGPAAVHLTAHPPVEHLEQELGPRAEQLYGAVNARLGAPPLDEVRIDLSATLDDAAHHLDWHLPGWAAGAARSREGEILLTVHKDGQRHDIERVLTHELAHVAIDSAAGEAEVPRWFNEGLARVIAREQGPDDAQRLALARLADRVPSLEGLTHAFPRAADDASLAYATSARAIELVMERGGPNAPAAILAALSAGVPFDDALTQATGLPTWQLQLRVRDSIARWPALLAVLRSSGVLWVFAGLLSLLAWRRLRHKRQDRLDVMADEESRQWRALGAPRLTSAHWPEGAPQRPRVVAWTVRPAFSR